MLEPDTRTPTPDPFAAARPRQARDAVELEALIDAANERLDTASPGLAGALRRGRASLELELADLLAR